MFSDQLTFFDPANFSLAAVAAPLLIIFLALYCVFSFVLYRQAKILINILGTPLSPLIKRLALFHFCFSFLMLVAAWLVA